MKKFVTVLMLVPLLTPAAPTPGMAAETASKAALIDDAAFDKATKAGRPAEMQALLATLIGNWDYTIKVWTDPSAEPDQSTGTTTNEMILEGRFLSMTAKSILGIGGRQFPFEERGVIGYDNLKKTFTSVWLNTLTSGMMSGIGTYTEKDKVIKETGTYTPLLKDAEQDFRSEFEFTSADTYKRTIYTVDSSGKAVKAIEIAYSRKK